MNELNVIPNVIQIQRLPPEVEIVLKEFAELDETTQEMSGEYEAGWLSGKMDLAQYILDKMEIPYKKVAENAQG